MFSTGNWEVGGGGAAETEKKSTDLKSAKGLKS